MGLMIPTFALYGEPHGGASDFWVHCEPIAARSSAHHWEIKLHRHASFFQFLFIRSGAGDALFSNGTVTLSPPCVVTIPPGTVHGYRFSRDVDGLVVTIVADRLPLTADLAGRSGEWLASPQVLFLDEADNSYFDATTRRVVQEFQSRRPDRNEFLETYLTMLLMLMKRNGEPQAFPGPGDARVSRVQTLKTLIDQQFREQHPAAHYARLLNLSPTHLNRIARQVTGLTVHDLIIERVIDEARRALLLTHASVQQISDGLGFSDPAYFSRYFRRKTGLAPGAFRRVERKKLVEARE